MFVVYTLVLVVSSFTIKQVIKTAIIMFEFHNINLVLFPIQENIKNTFKSQKLFLVR